jgi:NitT/TauT family transport system substrate-binding protein
MTAKLASSLVGLFAALLAACGGSAPATSPGPSAAAKAPATSSAPSAAAPASSAAAANPAAPSPAASGARDKIAAAYSTVSSTSTVPYVTKGGGFFEKYGLDASLGFVSPPALTGALTSGKDVDLAYASAASVVTLDAQGGDLVMIGAPVQGGIFSVVANPGIGSIADLKGKTVAIMNIGGTGDLMLRQLLTQNKLVPNTDVTLVTIAEYPALIAALKNGQVQAGVFSEPFTSTAVNQGGKVIFDQAKEGGKPIQSPITTKRGYIASHRDLLKRFLMANMDAVHLMKTNPAEAARYTQPYLKIDDQQVLRQGVEHMNAITDMDLGIPLSDLGDSMKIAAGSVPAVAKLKPEDVVDLSLIEEIKASGFLDKLYGK